MIEKDKRETAEKDKRAEKEKRKVHPFAGYVRPTEEVVWISELNQTSVWSHLKKIASLLIVIPLTYIVVELLHIPAEAVLYTTLIMFILIIVGLYMMSHFFSPVYAVTNERLLYLPPFAAISLEDIRSVEVFKDEEAGYDSIQFGALFPVWSHVENALQVMDVIEEARKKRMKAIGDAHHG